MKRLMIYLGTALGGMAMSVSSVWAAFPEDMPPTFANGSVAPQRTADPAAVASAQEALERFFEYTNQAYGMAGFANAWLMREELGNRQGDWLDRVLPLACGQLGSGWKGRSWTPSRGWLHETSSSPSGMEAPAECTFSPPGASSVDPDRTADPPAVRAAQHALADFFRWTNEEFSRAGYSNAWTMREELGNGASAWLDMTLPLARGQLVGGFRNMNWIPGRGWQHSAPPAGLILAPAAAPPVVAWSAERRNAAPLNADLSEAPRKPLLAAGDPIIGEIMQRTGIPQVDER